MRPPTPEDLRLLAWQLGRPPRGVLAVKPCPYGFPQVILNHPLIPKGITPGEREPMPTIFWLTCPLLVAEVSTLESAGAVKSYEQRLREDEGWARAYVRAHAAYRDERTSLLSPEELAWIKEKGFSSFLATGVAGISQPRRVKCLHAQLAHFLAGRDNPVGKAVAAELPQLFCPPARILCARELRADHIPGGDQKAVAA